MSHDEDRTTPDAMLVSERHIREIQRDIRLMSTGLTTLGEKLTSHMVEEERMLRRHWLREIPAIVVAVTLANAVIYAASQAMAWW